MALQEENYLVTTALSGQEGIELLKQEDFDLCLLDVEMPGMDGFEVLKWIRNNKRRVKVIFLTGDKELHIIEQGEALGVSDFMTKPIMVPVLKESIKNVLLH